MAGVDGNGQRALAEVVSGQRRLSHGEVRYLGAPVGKLSVAQREKLGLRYVTDDRLGEGIVASLPVSLNLVLKRIGSAPYWRRGRMHPEAIEQDAKRLIERFDIRTPSSQARAGTLSGGNIQKLLLARELSFESKVVVFHKPTYGLDLKTTRIVREMIGDLRQGRAALLISTDLDELLEVSDRIAVISGGRIVGVIENGPGVAEQVGPADDRRRHARRPGSARAAGASGMTDALTVPPQTGVTAVVEPPPVGEGGARTRSRRVARARDLVIRSLVPVVLALVAGGVLLAILGRDPFTFYSDVWQGGIQQGSWEDSAMLAAPLLLIGVGLTMIFRANIWNLGYDGQFLVGAALITGLAPTSRARPTSSAW